jgi:hypothetical protein
MAKDHEGSSPAFAALIDNGNSTTPITQPKKVRRL